MNTNSKANAKTRSKSTLFLMEQLVVIAVFAICAAVCVRLLFFAHETTQTAVDTRHALLIAENAAESFKAGGEIKTENFGDFVLHVGIHDNGAGVTFAEISVVRLSDDEMLVELSAARRTP